MLLCYSMPILYPQQPLSHLQRRVNKSALLLSVVIGAGIGVWQADRCASIRFGYVAAYSYATAVILAIALTIVGLVLLIYWRTRWFGIGLIAMGILSCAMFYGWMAVLLKEGRVAWHHEPPLVSFGFDEKASAVIYFRKGVTDQQIEDFNSTVLQEPAQPRHDGRDYPSFVRMYLRLLPSQAHGHEAVALTFSKDASSNQVNDYLATIKKDARVSELHLDISPNSIPALPDHP